MESREADEKKKSIENVLPDSVIFLILLLIQIVWIVGGPGKDRMWFKQMHCTANAFVWKSDMAAHRWSRITCSRDHKKFWVDKKAHKDKGRGVRYIYL